MAKLILFDNNNNVFLDKQHRFIELESFIDIISTRLAGIQTARDFILDLKQGLGNLKSNFNNIIKISDDIYTLLIPKDLEKNIPDNHYKVLSVKKLLSSFTINNSVASVDLLTKAKQLIFWNSNHRYCGRCGCETNNMQFEMAKECISCGFVIYPRISPCVLVAVINKNKILLGRAKHFPPGVYSLLAGFIETGETCEQTVAREVFEETAVKVNNISYFGSQSWPFPHSLMLAYTSDYVSGNIKVAKDELEDARWFTFEGLKSCPDLLPLKATLSRSLLDDLINKFTTG